MEPLLQTYCDKTRDIQTPADVAVVIPTLLRESLARAVRSVFQQDFKGTVQILIGIDQAKDSFDMDALMKERPAHMSVSVFWPGYSTSRKNGGQFSAEDGGSLRSLLSFFAQSRYVAYLDDDNWFAPDHIRRLYGAIEGKAWAFSERWFVTPNRLQPLCRDGWESVGPDQGVFQQNFGGFVDPNSLMIDMQVCAKILGGWCQPLSERAPNKSADRTLFSRLKKITPFGQTNQPTTCYLMDPQDEVHRLRLDHIEKNRINCGPRACPGWPGVPKPKRIPQRTSMIHGHCKVLGNTSGPHDISVVIPQIDASRLIPTLRYVFAQNFVGQIQILIHVDIKYLKNNILNDILHLLPKHISILFMDPGYQSKGVISPQDPVGSSNWMMTVLSYLAHAPYIAYFDSEHRWHDDHLARLFYAVQDKDVAFSRRNFVHPDGRTPICEDRWESLGPDLGYFAPSLGGYVDPSSLMLRTYECRDIFPLWTQPLHDTSIRLSTRQWVATTLIRHATWGQTNKVTLDCVLNPNHSAHKLRKIFMGRDWINADFAAFKTARKRTIR